MCTKSRRLNTNETAEFKARRDLVAEHVSPGGPPPKIRQGITTNVGAENDLQLCNSFSHTALRSQQIISRNCQAVILNNMRCTNMLKIVANSMWILTYPCHERIVVLATGMVTAVFVMAILAGATPRPSRASRIRKPSPTKAATATNSWVPGLT